ncbi:hypothetical protein [Vibrio parahaemolyticus]|uniref:hypothetical protein n=1 Tax=Vibrio parahaemolyticus TaxID=670 RepID=UPI001120DF31|nr:hypothetical protein [Vibrio parahaemolyticus]TOP47780.1 hypothetical protein CGH14_21745 [Vibrio parahaemolyticus]HCE3037112.1 hypothetical protein [Vibrio parahaemolyticus]HCG7351992.1 hypothetical protein [Vibrio parahaemolyticus]
MELTNTLTIAQLAFGVNAVIGFMLTRYFNEISSFTEKGSRFIGEHKVHEASFDVEEDDLIKALERVLPEFKIISRIYLIVMFYSFLCVIVSFSALILASLYPALDVSSFVFVLISFILVLLNPCLYYVVDRRFVIEYEHARMLMEDINQYAEDSEELQPFKSLIFYESYKRKYNHKW